MYIVAVSIVMGWVITMERLPHEAANAISQYIENPLIALFLINIFLIIVGILSLHISLLLLLNNIILMLLPFLVDQIFLPLQMKCLSF